MLTDIDVKEIESHAIDIRESVIKMLYKAKSGHTAGSLDMADIFATLYFKILKHNPVNPQWENRDRVILSNGHICPVLYATMAHSGYFNIAELDTLRQFGSRLQGHPHREYLSALETSSGPLGSGLSQAIGMAIVDRFNRPASIKRYFYCFIGDGEMNEGQIWESLLLLNKYKLDNIIVIVDRNRIQIDGDTEDVLPLEPLYDKLSAFGIYVHNIDGHNIREIYSTIELCKSQSDNANIIIANTIAGKGWKKIEGDYHWHGKSPSINDIDDAYNSLDNQYNFINN